MDDDTHPSDEAYQAGQAFAKSLRRRGGRTPSEAGEAALALSKAYDDEEAYMDGYWDAFHREA